MTCSGFTRPGRRLRLEALEPRRVLAAWVVDTELDVVDAGDGTMSLREAVAAANGTPGADDISFAPQLAGKAIVLRHGELAVTDDLTIDGLGKDQLGIDASGSDPSPAANNGDGSRIFNINDGDDLTHINVQIRGLTLLGGDVAERGGAIRSTENLTLEWSLITQNSAGHAGGGLYVRTLGGARAVVAHTIIQNNVTTGTTFNGSGFGGGAYFDAHGESGITVVDSEFLYNRALRKTQFGGYGAGLYANTWDNAALHVSDSVMSGNTTGGNERGGGAYVRAFNDSRATLEGVTISGNTAGSGAGAYLSSTETSLVVLERSRVDDNKTTGTFGRGGGVHAHSSGESTLAVQFNTIEDNWGRSGGGIYAFSIGLSVMTLDSNLVFRNQAGFLSTTGDLGGGIFARPNQDSRMSIVNSTIASNLVLNTTTGGGGGVSAHVFDDASLSILSSTIILNTSSGRGGGVWIPESGVPGGVPRLLHTIVANNNAGGSNPVDVVGAVLADWNLIGDSAGAMITGGNNLLDLQPMLLSRSDNGGPTTSFEPQANSPAVDAGDPAAAVGDGVTPAYDQRGFPYSRVSGGRLDIGAVERQGDIVWADFDNDFDVDGRDFLTWQRGFGTALPAADPQDGDADDDLDVDGTDLDAWASQFGTAAPAALQATAVRSTQHALAVDAAMAYLTSGEEGGRRWGRRFQSRRGSST
jgi:hypothetical protein